MSVTQAPLHPAVPDPREEIHEISTNQYLTCKNYTFPPQCDLYPYIQFWKQQLNSQDCHKVLLSQFTNILKITNS